MKLVAISKTKPVEMIQEAYTSGHTVFGENKVQEMLSKYEQLPKNIEWHLVGHLQSNKVKYIATFVHLIHSVDSKKLLQEIGKQALKNHRVQKVLLQIFIAREETKFGLDRNELFALLDELKINPVAGTQICGLMGMATNTDDETQIRNEFAGLKTLFEEVKTSYYAGDENFCELSMGMSSDYRIAMEEGSTMVRVGSLVFGER